MEEPSSRRRLCPTVVPPVSSARSWTRPSAISMWHMHHGARTGSSSKRRASTAARHGIGGRPDGMPLTKSSLPSFEELTGRPQVVHVESFESVSSGPAFASKENYGTTLAKLSVGVRFATDSALEGDGFEPSVPRPRRALLSGPLPLVAAKGGRRRSRHCGSARFLLLGKPFHRAGGVHGFGGLRFVALLGGFCVPAVQLIYTFAFHRLDQQFAERPYQGINAVR